MFNQGFESTSTYIIVLRYFSITKISITEWLDENLKTKFTGETNLETDSSSIKCATRKSTNYALHRLDTWKLRVSLRQAHHNQFFSVNSCINRILYSYKNNVMFFL